MSEFMGTAENNTSTELLPTLIHGGICTVWHSVAKTSQALGRALPHGRKHRCGAPLKAYAACRLLTPLFEIVKGLANSVCDMREESMRRRQMAAMCKGAVPYRPEACLGARSLDGWAVPGKGAFGGPTCTTRVGPL